MKGLTLLSLFPSLTAAFQAPSVSRLQLSSTTLGRRLSESSLEQAETDDEWHPHDPSDTIPQLLSSLWSQIAQAGNMVKGVSASQMDGMVELVHLIIDAWSLTLCVNLKLV
jgi:hypothetical protein